MVYYFSLLSLFILLQVAKSFSQEHIKFSNLERNQSAFVARKLSACPTTCVLCKNDDCLQCSSNRVVPNCDCKEGYFSNSGVCTPCSTGCKVCSDALTCTLCYDQYNLASNACNCKVTTVGGVCNDPTILYYTTQVGFDMKSIVIEFNSVITIANVNYDFTFTSSIANCVILSSQTQQDYGIISSSIYPGSCYINKSYQNRFVINLGSGLNSANLLTPPQIVVSNVLIFSQTSFIAVSSQTAVSSEQSIGKQLNVMPPICSFSYSSIMANTQIQTQIPILTPYPFTGALSSYKSNLSCTVVSPSFQTSPIIACDDVIGLYIQPGIVAAGSQAIFSVSCTGLFGYTSTDTVTITYTGINYSIIKPQPSISQINPYSYLRIFGVDQITSGILATYTAQVASTYNALVSATSIIGTTQTTTFSVPAQVTSDTVLIAKITGQQIVNQITISTNTFALVSFMSTFTVFTTFQDTLTNADPSRMKFISQIMIDGSTVVTGSFNALWYCYTLTNTPCLDRSGNTISSLANDLNLNVPSQLFQYGYSFKLFLVVTRVSNSYSPQIQIFQITTGTASLTLSSTKYTNIYYSDLLSFQLSFTSSFTQVLPYTYQVTLTDTLSNSRTINYSSNLFTFTIYDVFPNLALATNHIMSIAFSVYNSQTLSSYSDSSLNYQITIYSPPSGCQVSIGSQQSFISNTVSLISCASNGNTYSYQFFLYSTITLQQQEIVSSGSILTRQMLSLPQATNTVSTYLPPGDLIIMAVILQNSRTVFNYTLPVTISENNFSTTTYETLLLSQYSNAQQFQQNSQPDKELFEYQTICFAVEYYEAKNSTYTPSSDINNMKSSIVQRLSDVYWSSQTNSISLLASQINLRMKNTKISLSPEVQQQLVQQNQQQTTLLLQNIQNSLPLTSEQQTQFQAQLSTNFQDFMSVMNSMNQWDSTNSQNAVTQSASIMSGISLTMVINQSPVTVQSIGVALKVEKYNYNVFMEQYYPSSPTTPNQPNASLTYYIQTQTWSTSQPIFRDEISAINEQYMSTTNETLFALLNKTYPVIVPQVLSDSSTTRRILTQAQANLQLPFKVSFGAISQSEKVACIQKNSISGKWATSSCTAYEEQINGERHVGCSCSTPGVTSMIADIAALFDNETLKDIFSSTGFWRVFTLPDWYKYAPIWTIVGLNICLVIFLFIGFRLDKQDSLKVLKKAFLFKKQPKSGYDEKQENNFMKIKNVQRLANKRKKTRKGDTQIYRISEIPQKLNRSGKSKKTRKSIFFQVLKHDEQPYQQTLFTEQNKQNEDMLVFKEVNTPEQNQLETLESVAQTPIKLLFQEKDEGKMNVLDLENPIQITDEQEIQDTEENIVEEGVSPIHLDALYPSKAAKCGSVLYELEKRDTQDQNGQQIIQQNNHDNEDNITCQTKTNQTNSDEIKSDNSPSHFQQQHDEQLINKIEDEVEEKQIKGQEEEEEDVNNHIQKEEIEQQEIVPETINIHQISVQQGDIESQQVTVQTNSGSQNSPSKNESKLAQKIQKKQEDQLKKKREILKFEGSKQKLKQYLDVENIVKATFSFHMLFSTFIIYNSKFSRVLRFLIFYNKIVWNLAISSVFGLYLSIVQTIVLSIISAICLLLITTILVVLCKYKKLRLMTIIVQILFDLFCYYSVLVAVSKETPYESNIWIAKYFLTIFFQEMIIGMIISFGLYYLCYKCFDKLSNPLLFDILGAGLIIDAFSN